MGTLLSQMNYGFANGVKPLQIGNDDDNKKSTVGYDDFIDVIKTSEETLSQVITQHNQALTEQENQLSSSGVLQLTTVSGSATLSDVITAFNSLQSSVQSFLTNLNSKPK